ncbi:hypothetical protein [Haliangium sp.]|uniref:hypothetical protein n=1 Tax=Haliangium sp. TaxID=2663208 RepID=UPI003D12B3A5
MTSLSKTWIEVGHPDRLALEAQPVLAAYLPYVEDVHNELVEVHAASVADRLTDISEQQQQLDVRHDALARGIRSGVQSQIHLSASPEAVAEWREIDERLFPNGLEFVNYSYRETAGHAELFAARLTGPLRERLANTKTAGDASLLDAAENLVQVAREIGALEHERGQSTDRRVTVARTRGKWTRMVLTLQQIVQTLGVTDQVVLDIMARIDTASQNAERRNRGGDDGEPVGELPDDETPDTAPPEGDTPGTELPEGDAPDAPGEVDEVDEHPEGLAAATNQVAHDPASDVTPSVAQR